ncbi:MAG: hypothetical protein CMJ70_22285, partial [Planctomycetaceae bacterium]|nr:hypothetical protein [Planctomycetaceae bacterium]
CPRLQCLAYAYGRRVIRTANSLPLRHQNHAAEPSKTWADRNGSLEARTGRHAQRMNSWRPGYDCRQLSSNAVAAHRISKCHRTVKPISETYQQR